MSLTLVYPEVGACSEACDGKTEKKIENVGRFGFLASLSLAVVLQIDQVVETSPFAARFINSIVVQLLRPFGAFILTINFSLSTVAQLTEPAPEPGLEGFFDAHP